MWWLSSWIDVLFSYILYSNSKWPNTKSIWRNVQLVLLVCITFQLASGNNFFKKSLLVWKKNLTQRNMQFLSANVNTQTNLFSRFEKLNKVHSIFWRTLSNTASSSSCPRKFNLLVRSFESASMQNKLRTNYATLWVANEDLRLTFRFMNTFFTEWVEKSNNV